MTACLAVVGALIAVSFAAVYVQNKQFVAALQLIGGATLIPGYLFQIRSILLCRSSHGVSFTFVASLVLGIGLMEIYALYFVVGGSSELVAFLITNSISFVLVLTVFFLCVYFAPATVVILEGTSCVGKTTALNKYKGFTRVHLDFLEQAQQEPRFFNKLHDTSIEIVYATHIMQQVQGLINAAQNTVIDRCHLSNFVYHLIFKHKGHLDFLHLQQHCLEDFEFYLKYVEAPSATIIVYINSNVEAVVANLQRRGSFENSGFNLASYVKSQNFLFAKLANALNLKLIDLA